MLTLLSERFARITSRIGFLELPLDDVAEGLVRWRKSLYGSFGEVEVSRLSDGLPEALGRMEPLVGGLRPRELIVRAGEWTAYFDCLLTGTDPISTVGFLSRELQCQGLAITTVPRTVGKAGIRNGRLGAVQFQLFGPVDTDFLNYVRTVEVVFDGGRWQFDVSGTEQPFEEVDAYRAHRARARFTSEMLERYCRALGIDVFNPNFYGPEAVVVESPLSLSPNDTVMSLQEAQQWREIVPGMADGLPG